MHMYQIQRYTYHFFSSRSEDDLVILFYDTDSTIIGEARFVRDGSAIPPATEKNGRHLLFFCRSSFPDIIDMLRNEGPVFLRWADGVNTTLSTGYEPVGEGE
ncbi:MAG: hypothetical protein OEZ54_10920 [Gemmatimonadota bacterium]|nr:hypothetical protein [Gemmatimonadota bacterium]